MRRIVSFLWRSTLMFVVLVLGCGLIIGSFTLWVAPQARYNIFETAIIGLLMLALSFSALTGFFILLSK